MSENNIPKHIEIHVKDDEIIYLLDPVADVKTTKKVKPKKSKKSEVESIK